MKPDPSMKLQFPAQRHSDPDQDAAYSVHESIAAGTRYFFGLT